MRRSCFAVGSILLLVLGFRSSFGASPENFDFEQAYTNSVTYDPSTGIASAPIQDLLPGWTITTSAAGVPGVLNRLAFNSPNAQIGLVTYDPYPQIIPMTGRYSLDFNVAGATVTLEYRGVVPNDPAHPTMEMVGALNYGPGSTGGPVLINGGYVHYAPDSMRWDVSPYAGQQIDLTWSFGGPVNGRLDGFSFIVPEPRPLSLWLATGGVLGIGSLCRGRVRAIVHTGKRRTV